ncbi:hypothetical protein RND81_14G144600 [Saponaria officinalis]|uniref:Uncharacterized protein n=1 Tax=Saponaria officinalis TaxID=3572 RepID=A0AAW1GQD7_SAPOF
MLIFRRIDSLASAIRNNKVADGVLLPYGMWISELLEYRGAIQFSDLGILPSGEVVKNLLGQMRLRLDDFVEDEPPVPVEDDCQAPDLGMFPELLAQCDALTGMIEQQGAKDAKNNRRVVYLSDLIQAQSNYIDTTNDCVSDAFDGIATAGAIITANQCKLHRHQAHIIDRLNRMESQLTATHAMVKSLHDLFGASSTSAAAPYSGRGFALPPP